MSINNSITWGGIQHNLQVLAPYLLLSMLIVTLFSWFQFPALPSNDDALFLGRGVGHFSVIEFSPHFPGYAGLILFVKSVRGLFSSDYQALHGVVLCMTAMIPIVSYLILRALSVEPILATGVSASIYLQPLLISVALSGLSDGPGLFIWMLSLLFLLKGQGLMSAFFSGLMLTVRPSYLFLFLPVYGFLVKQYRSKLNLLLSATIAPLLLVFIYMYSKDGLALVEEAIRFVRGHFLVWGNTSLNSVEHVSWWEAMSAYLGSAWALTIFSVILLPGCCFIWFKLKPARCLIISFVSILMWTLFFQNPENLRHLLPLAVLATLLAALVAALLLKASSLLSFMFMVSAIFSLLLVNIQLDIKPPAIHQALRWLNLQPINKLYDRVILTNEGVELMKVYQQKRRVADAWYKQQGEWLWQNGAWRLSFSPLVGRGNPVKIFPHRFEGEHTIFVYHMPLEAL